MDLSAWRDQAPIGAFLQPIRLAVAGSNSRSKSSAGGPQADASAATEASDPSTNGSASAPADAATTVATNGDAAANFSESSGAKKPVRRRQKAVPQPPAARTRADSLVHEESELVIEPLESARVQRRGDRMVLNAGGPVWALDWLPQEGAARRRRRSPASATAAAKQPKQHANGSGSARTPEPHDDKSSDSDEADDPPDARAARETLAQEWRFLALSAHPPCELVDGKLAKPTPPDHYFNVDEPATARSLIQIWAVPVHQKQSALDGDAAAADAREPKLVFAIDHDSGVAWDVQWSPLVCTMPKRIRSRKLLGVLAVCFGDGSLQIFEVPAIAPESLTPEGLSKPGLVEKLQPTVRANVPNVLQLSVQWSPHRWNLILTGGSDGA